MPETYFLSINLKSITYKKKDKDFFILEVVVVSKRENTLQIFEVSVDNEIMSKLSHKSEEIG